MVTRCIVGMSPSFCLAGQSAHAPTRIGFRPSGVRELRLGSYPQTASRFLQELAAHPTVGRLRQFAVPGFAEVPLRQASPAGPDEKSRPPSIARGENCALEQ